MNQIKLIEAFNQLKDIPAIDGFRKKLFTTELSREDATKLANNRFFKNFSHESHKNKVASLDKNFSNIGEYLAPLNPELRHKKYNEMILAHIKRKNMFRREFPELFSANNPERH